MARNILIVEDEQDISESLIDLLESEGFGVQAVTNGREALSALDSPQPPSLILLDLLMPVMNGTEFIGEKRNDKRFKNIPIIVMSANNRTKQTAESHNLHYIQKPFELDKLLAAIEELCPNGA